MDAERDVIKFDVMNMLNARYRSRRINFQAIDLRAGINTEVLSEQKREERIIDVCFHSIDTSRPFFIGLLGERYGWIPPLEKKQGVINHLPPKRRHLLEGIDDVSITEMEILYGAIGNNGENIDHSLFFYRSPESYTGIPEDKRHMFFDNREDSADIRRKKERLHRKILDVLSRTSDNDLWTEYSLKYNRDTETFDGLDTLAHTIFEKLSQIIDRELDAAAGCEATWWERERETSEHQAESYVINTAERTDIPLQSDTAATVITGDPRSGKSTFLSMLYENTTAEKHIAYAGQTRYAQKIRHILIRWLCEMRQLSADEEIPDTEQLPDIELYRKFQQAASERDAVFFLDNIDALPGDERLLSWLSKDIHIFMTGSDAASDKLKQVHTFLGELRMPPLSRAEKESILSHYEHDSYFELPQGIRLYFLDNRINAGEISLGMKLMTGLSSRDFAEIRHLNGSIEEINAYMLRIFEESRTSAEGQFRYTLQRFARNICQSAASARIFDFLACSRLGLRESDLEALMGTERDPVAFNRIVSYFSDWVVMDTDTRRWTLTSASVLDELTAHAPTEEIYAALSRHFMNVPDDDGLKREMLLYYLIKAHCPQGATDYLSNTGHFTSTDDISEWFRLVVPVLVSDPNMVEDVEACCARMNDNETAGFLSLLLDHGFKFAEHQKLYVEIASRCAPGVNISALSEVRAFILGWVFSHTNLYIKHNSTLAAISGVPRTTLIERGLECFRQSLKLNPEKAKAKNMITVMASELMELYIDAGDFDKAMKIYSDFNT